MYQPKDHDGEAATDNSQKKSGHFIYRNHECPDPPNCQCFVDKSHPCLAAQNTPEKLHMIVPINNYMRFQSRYKLFNKFKKDLEKQANIELYVVEVALGDRPFMVTEPNNPKHLQLRTVDEIWHKENSINLAARRLLPEDWKYMAWVDGDIRFNRENIADETIHALQRWSIVQMFRDAINLGPKGEVLSKRTSFGYMFNTGQDYKCKGYDYWHPGFAWACTRKAYRDMGGLLDFSILGNGDHHMALCLIGKYEISVPKGMGSEFTAMVKNYQDMIERKELLYSIGYVDGTIMHYFHGKAKDRGYVDRWQILIKNNYNPITDISLDERGLYKLNDNKPLLRIGCMRYFEHRNEDSIDNE